VEKGNEVSNGLMDGSVKFADAEYQRKAAGQFIEQTELGRGPRFVRIGLVRSKALRDAMWRIRQKIPKPKTADEHALFCALRVWTYFLPGYQWSQQTVCVKCQKVMSSVDEISIVALAIPPWDGKRHATKTATANGFFCSACDVKDDEAMSLWRKSLSRDGIILSHSPQEGSA
jgi:hypothetical protein